MEKSSESEEFGPAFSKQSNMISYPLVKWFALFATNQKPIFNRAAGVTYASKTSADKHYVKETTEKIKAMVFAMDNKSILTKLSSRDIVSNKLNYHKSCYKDFVNKCNQKTLVEPNDELSLQNGVNKFLKANCSKKVLTYTREIYVRGIAFEASAKIRDRTRGIS